MPRKKKVKPEEVAETPEEVSEVETVEAPVEATETVPLEEVEATPETVPEVETPEAVPTEEPSEEVAPLLSEDEFPLGKTHINQRRILSVRVNQGYYEVRAEDGTGYKLAESEYKSL